jgi:hypothetical protein
MPKNDAGYLPYRCLSISTLANYHISILALSYSQLLHFFNLSAIANDPNYIIPLKNGS